MIDRSATPRASQQQQRQQQQQQQPQQQQQSSRPHSPPFTRRSKNRSRSGSEELSQIIAQAQANAARFGGAVSASGFWPLGATDSLSRPETVTPTPYNAHHASQQQQHENATAYNDQQSRTSSPPGLLGWVRSAFMLGPSGRNLDITTESVEEDQHAFNNDGHRSHNTAAQKYNSRTVYDDDPIRRNTTPLLPGILPSFHHIDQTKSREHEAVEFTPVSERSSISFDGGDDATSSMGHGSIEESLDYDRKARRASSMSTASSATAYDNDEDDGEGSDTEDVYAPFSQRAPLTDGPLLVRPTARREPLGFGPPLDNDDDKSIDKDGTGSLPGRRHHTRQSEASEHSLSIGEAQDATHYVTDNTDHSALLPSVVVTSDPSQTFNPQGSDVRFSPISGWIESNAISNKSSGSTPRPKDERDHAFILGTQTLPVSTIDSTLTASSGFRTANDVRPSMDATGVDFSDDERNRNRQIDRRPSYTGSTDSTMGDGEDLNDMLGRPKSPEELMRFRQSRESVALGSRGASTRAGNAAPIRRARNVSAAKSLVEAVDQLQAPLVGTKSNSAAVGFDVAEKGNKLPISLPKEDAAAIADSAETAARQRGARDGLHTSENGTTVHAQKPSQDANELASPIAVRSRRPLGFLSRRKSSSGNAREGHSRAASLDYSKASSKRDTSAAAGTPTSFWRMGRRSMAQDSPQAKQIPLPTLHDELVHDSPADEKTGKAIKEVGGVDSALKSQLCPHERLAKRKTIQGALGISMRPRKIKVRSRNKPSRECDFAQMYLAQELFLTPPPGPDDQTISRSPKPSPALKPHVVKGATVSTEAAATINGDQHSDRHHMASNTTTTHGGAMAGKRKATWAMRFSMDGRYLAVAGQDAVIRVYAVLSSAEARQGALADLRERVTEHQQIASHSRSATTLSSASDNSHSQSSSELPKKVIDDANAGKSSLKSKDRPVSKDEMPHLLVFSQAPVREFRGHTSDILDLSWSKGGFLLSASMDSTARVWHLSKPHSLVAFKHGDFVTCAVFHPRDDRFFLSGSLDGKVRLWNISAKRVQATQEVPGLITACAFTNSGKTACVGTFSGAALFYHTDDLTFASSVAVRSSTGKHSKGGRKITAIEPILPDVSSVGYFNGGAKASAILKGASQTKEDGKDKVTERVLITSNDSLVRAYDIDERKIIARFKAKTYNNRSSQIRATMSDDNAYIVAGSEATSSSDGGQVHVWECASILFESSSKGILAKLASGGMQAMAAANQRTSGLLRSGSRRTRKSSTTPSDKSHPTSASSTTGKKMPLAVTSDSVVEYFTAHAGTVTCAIMAPIETNNLLRQANDPIVLESESKVRAQMREGATLVEAISGLSSNVARTITHLLQAPGRATSGGGGVGSAKAETGETTTLSAAEAELEQLTRKLNRIIVSVDDNAIVRVWRSDSLQTMMANTSSKR